MAAVIEVENLSKRYGDTTAVDGVSFTVQEGEIFGILGANGAGKTTSVEIAQGLRRPDRGTIRVLGHDPIADRFRLRGRVGSQLQDANLPDRLRVRCLLARGQREHRGACSQQRSGGAHRVAHLSRHPRPRSNSSLAMIMRWICEVPS